MKDKDGYWYGYEVEKLAIAINKERWNEEIAPLGFPYPSRWQDLLNPVYKERLLCQIQMFQEQLIRFSITY